MQAVYPSNLVFTAEDIKNGGSILFLLGKILLLFKLLLRYRLLLLRHSACYAKLH